MIKNYFKIGFRNLVHNKLYAAVNIGGLAVGIGCFTIIMLFVQHELSYDRFYSHAGRIYRVYQKQTGNTFLGSEFFAVTPTRLGGVLEEECPEVEVATTLKDQHALLGHDNNHYWQYGLAADDQFFKIFKPEFIRGGSQNVFGHARSIVLTASLAEKIFGDENAVGKLITYQNNNTYTVTGVVNDPPFNSSFQYTYIVDIRSIDAYAKDLGRTTWRGNNAQTFLLLKPNATVAALEQKFAGIIKKYRDPEAYANYPFQDQYFLERIEDLHLHAGINFDMGTKGNRQYIHLFSWVAVIVLVLACVNYMSLAVARSARRVREIGIRKVVGAQRSQIIAQFLGESVLITFFAMALGLILAALLLPTVGHWMDRPITLNFTQNAWLLPALLALLVAVGLFSGSYPSLFLSSLRPIIVLKGKTGGTSALPLQRILIVAQYTVSITLVIGSLVIHHQLQYMNKKDLGYDRKNIITIQLLDRSVTIPA
ncbi:ABC transporter permease [Fulvivirgaceae bacterium PWU4]|uniref:ABC transporter permease n=1 Tax=Chryseosolibacter histidini TaxID=2782349 RepID=A0AAP2DH78_9BACT|nr:ABC transporter permease [Chryseosolibacter histidini]MBT1696191.1 ABC transporter permease [Chryseosolibacter histidini]